MSTRIDYRRTPVPEASRILQERHGGSAATLARQNEHRATSSACADYWRRVREHLLDGELDAAADDLAGDAEADWAAEDATLVEDDDEALG